jgi:hypothetical protein
MLETIVESMLFALLGFIFLIGAILLIKWAINDARRRRKSPLLVCVAVVLFFPLGWIAWLLFRPNLSPPPIRVFSAR